MVLKARILFLILSLFIAFQAVAQVSFDSQEELEKAANSFFDAKDYSKAKPLFSQLLSKDALNADYNYRFGVCILFTEADPLKPLPYIEGGASTKGVNVEAHYFLGKAFQLNYRFDDAIKSYEKGKSLGFSMPGIDLDRSIQECRNGKILYNPAIDFEPAMDKEVIASEFYRPYDFRKLKGKVIPMPPEFKTKYDEKNLVGTVIYTPVNSQTLIYASYGEDGSNAKDLYRVNRLPNGELALPLRLPNTINTKYDEDYAFYDEESQMLFFASKGHNSMGGYDVFSSKYNANNSTWSTPLNLQYPVNSPYDDFLYVSDPEGKVAFFTSDRNVEAGKLRVMKTLLHDPEQVEVSVVEGTFFDKTDSVYNYAALTVLDPITNEVVGKYRSHKVTGKYLLILPPQNDYKMDVGPREANGFTFDLDVPKQESASALQQAIMYNSANGNGTVTVTNYFDATGNPDTVKFAESRSLKDIEERMVAMPDPSEILAAKSQLETKKKDAEKEALAAAEKAKQAEELALKEKQAAEEAAARAEQAQQLAMKQAEELALKEKQAAEEAAEKAEQAQQLATKQAEELALKEKLAAEVAEKQNELALAEKNRLDSIQEAEKQSAELAAKEDAEKAQQAEELALKEKLAAEEAAKQNELALAEKNRLDSIQEAEKQAAELAAKEDAKKAKQAEALALNEKLAAEEAAKLDELAKAEQTRLDSIREAEKQAIDEIAKQQQLAQAEKARIDSVYEAEKRAIELAKDEEDATLEQPGQIDFIAQAKEDFTKDSIRQVEEFEKLHASHIEARARRDSINKAIELAELKETQDKAKKDSIAAAELAFEQERLAQLQLIKERQNLLTQIKAAEVKTELAVLDVEQNEVAPSEPEKSIAETATSQTEASVNQNEKVPAEPSLEIAEATTEVIEAKNELAEPVIPQDLPVLEPVDTEQPATANLTNTEVLSESELFLQTIAKLEAQKREQEQLVEVENTERQKRLADQKLAQAEAKRAADTSAVKTQADGSELNSNVSLSEQIANDTSDVETMSVALKSDADPQEYLAALAAIEEKIEKEAAANTSKSYELKELPNPPANSHSVDPVLQATIDADRKALADHQLIAVQKEKALNEQMQRDRAAVKSLDQNSKDELAAAESEILENANSILEKAPQTIAEPKTAVITKAVEPTVETEKAEEPKVEVEVEVETTQPTQEATNSLADQEVLDALAEFDRILSKSESSDSVAVAVEVEKTVVELPAIEQETAPSENIEVVVEVEEPTTEKEELVSIVAEELVSEEQEPVVEQILEESTEQVIVSKPQEQAQVEELVKPRQAATGTVGTIPFMTAAKRSYSTVKPSFDKIEDVSMRRMVQRMRSEDIGRMAVLKNMKNEWVDAGKSDAKLKEIKGNSRNQDVLESVAAAPSREEYVRPPFDKNHLKKRQDVYYKLDFRITTTGVSQTISESMSPEQAISFAMPEFQLQTGCYHTLADATSDLKEFQRRGFDSVRIVPYLKNVPISLSDVENVPFVD